MKDLRYQNDPVYREEQKKRERERYHRRKEQLGKWWREKWINDPEWKARKLAKNKRYRQSEKGRATRNRNAKESRYFWRMQLFNVLGGPKCIKCGYDADHRALQFDHIVGGGRKHRESLPKTEKYYRIYAENPELAKKTFQVMCAICNTLKRFDNKEM